MLFFSRRPISIQSSAKVLAFDPPAIVRAITFHLLDEGNARTINRESSQTAVDALSRRKSQLIISASLWAAMNNVQRLQWLLKQSHIVVTSPSSSRPARLSVGRWRALVTSELIWGRH
jgi:DNA-binding NtrC family response regulator